MTGRYDTPMRLDRMDGGLNDSQNPAIIQPNQATALANVELDRASVKASRGARKLNNQEAPRPGIRTTVDASYSPLYVEAGKSVPLRGYGYLPYNESQDMGGDFESDDAAVGSELFHIRQGKSFEIAGAFRLPADEKFYDTVRGSNSGYGQDPTDADVIAIEALGGYDEALEECTCIIQKGGDRLAPMSWALAIVNTGDNFEYITGAATERRPSNYALVFMWLDAPEWGENDGLRMRYILGTGLQANVGTTGTGATMTYRAIIAKKFIEPGKSYRVSVGLQLDSGSPHAAGTAADPTASWTGDGNFFIAVTEEGESEPTVCETLGTDLFVWKGPDDSHEYLKRYGVRYSGRDAMFLGLGYRFAPWAEYGFLPFGLDSASLEKGGFRMIDVSEEVGTFAPTALTCDHTASDANLVVNLRYLTTGDAAGTGQNPLGPTGAVWSGLASNPDALKKYWGVPWGATGGANWEINGARFKLRSYEEIAGPVYRIGAHASSLSEAWAGRMLGIICFRWHQRPLVLSAWRVYSEPRTYTADSLANRTLQMDVDPKDSTHPGIENLVGCWGLDDGGGAVLKESMAGNHGYLAPFGMGVSDNGTRGNKRLFLSGEGEALTLDFDKDPVLKREIQHMLARPTKGMAIELTMVLPEASYGVDEASAGPIYTAKYAPALFTWEIADPENDGLVTAPKPLMELTHRASWGTNTLGIRRPLGFTARVASGHDQQDEAMESVSAHYDGGTGTFYWDTQAGWVGKTITMQLGIQPTGVNNDEYDVILAFTPKGDLVPESGDPAHAEGHWIAANTRIERADLVRSVITFGGRYDPDPNGVAYGYTEMGARIMLDEVRIFAAPAPGAKAASYSVVGSHSLGRVDARNGKLGGSQAMPSRELDGDDILRSLGDGILTANLTEGDLLVTPPGSTLFYTTDPWETLDSANLCYLIVRGDEYETRNKETYFEVQDEFYFIASVGTGALLGTYLNLIAPYNDPSRNNASARVFRLIGYTSFSDDIRDKPLTLGQGHAFDPGVTTVDDVVVSEDFFFNHTPCSVNFKLRIYSPLAHSSVRETLPMWVRGVAVPRNNPVLGMHTQGEFVYAATRGSLYRVYDRWSADHPKGVGTRSLELLGRRHKTDGVYFPLHRDWVELNDADGLSFTYPASDVNKLYDAWVKLDELAGIQTLAWVGRKDTNPALLAGATSTTHQMHIWLRFTNGRPELVIGSTETYDGSNRPEKGHYVATGDVPIPAREWVMVRWILPVDYNNDLIDVPHLYINGKLVNVTVNAYGNGTGGDPEWLTLASVPATTSDFAAFLGAARDSYESPSRSTAFVEDTITGGLLRPSRIHGTMHSIRGKVASLVASNEAFGVDAPPHEPLDPVIVSYLMETFRMDFEEGIGHESSESVGDQEGTIHAHPAISLLHEFGSSEKLCAWAPYRQKLYVTNGERPAYIDGDRGALAGLLPPTSKPTAEIVRTPIWEPNHHETAGNLTKNDPIQDATAGTDPLFHYRFDGNTYLRQSYHSKLAWEESDYFAFKCYIRPAQVSGRIPLFSTRDKLSSGNIFIDIVDGKLRVGWWDTVLKSEEYIETSAPVFKPGFVHYVYVRKRYPRRDLGIGCWYDSIFEQTATETRDMVVVRRMPKATVLHGDDVLSAQIAARSCISFTADQYDVAGCEATGLVSNDSETYTGAAAGVINAVTGSPFHDDMVHFYWQFGNTASAGVQGKVYKITAVNSATQIVVKGLDLVVPDLSAEVGVIGGVFTGIKMVPSDNFTIAEHPDKPGADIELFGSRLCQDPTSGLKPFVGRVWSFGYVIDNVPGGANADLFELGTGAADDILIGTDDFNGHVYNSPPCGELHFTAPYVFTVVDGRDYAETDTSPVSTQPNSNLRIDMDAGVACYADSEAEPIFVKRLEELPLLSGTRHVRVAFFSREQNQLSNPSPNYFLAPSGEDESNPSGTAKLVLTNLPVPMDRDADERWIFLSLGNGQELYRVAILPDIDSSSITISLSEFRVEDGPALEFDNAQPPRCSVLAVSQNSLVFGNLEKQSDAIQWSKPYQPTAVPHSNFLRYNTGRASEIVGLADHRGKGVLFKADAMSLAILRYGQAFTEDVFGSEGLASHASIAMVGRILYFMSDRGPSAWLGTGEVIWLGRLIRTFLQETIDREALERAYAAINRARNQYLVLVRESGSDYMDERLSLEFDGEQAGSATSTAPQAAFRISRYYGPNLTAIASVLRPGGGFEQLIGGTQEGLFCYLDDPDTLRLLVRPTDTVEYVVSSTASAKVVVTGSPTIDENLANMRGCMMEWYDSNGDRHRATILHATGSTFYLDRDPDTRPEDGARVTVGSPERKWTSKWFSLGYPEKRKDLGNIDIICGVEGSGTMTMQLFLDRDDSTVVKEYTVDLSQSHNRLRLGQHHARWFKLNFTTKHTVDIDFELLQVVFRPAMADPV